MDNALHEILNKSILKKPPFSSINKAGIRHKFPKTGSNLSVLYDAGDTRNPINGVVINTISNKSASIWVELRNSSLPVAPILNDLHTGKLRVYPALGETSRIYSRYCGQSLMDIFATYGYNVAHNEFTHLGPNDQYIEIEKRKSCHLFIKKLLAQFDDFYTQLEQRNLDHEHLHAGNFTFELIEKGYYKDQLTKNKTINNIEFSPSHWSFNPEDYITNQKKWELIVRLIDFDRIKSEAKKTQIFSSKSTVTV